MDVGRTNKLKEKYLGDQLRSIRELQVAKYELTSSSKSIYTQLPNSNIFFVSSMEKSEYFETNSLKINGISFYLVLKKISRY